MCTDILWVMCIIIDVEEVMFIAIPTTVNNESGGQNVM